VKILYFFLIILTAVACKDDKQTEPTFLVYRCGAEQKVVEGESVFFETVNMRFFGGSAQSDEAAFNGKYSAKLDSVNQYGMSCILENIEKGNYIEASIWQKNEGEGGNLVISAAGDVKLNLVSGAIPQFIEKDGWKQHFLSFTANSPIDSLKIFAFAGKNEAYFDDLEIKVYQTRPLIDKIGDRQLEIFIPDTSLVMLDTFLADAANKAILPDEFKEYFNADIIDSLGAHTVEMRLKGDWTDHLNSGNVSYRIKTSSDYAFDGMRSFSIQHPKTRNFMHEWFMHELCEKEGLLATGYDFTQAHINGEEQGVYAVEEHFDKQLIERNMRREGPILKIDETGFWALAIAGRTENIGGGHYPYYESAIISVFKESRTRKSKNLFDQFQNGAKLLRLFKNAYKHPEHIFDMDKLAKYYALMDLGNVHHTHAWHNRRFYYNPVTAKLEHIGYDMIPMGDHLQDIIALKEFKYLKKNIIHEFALNRPILLNAEFREKYIAYLTQFSSDEYLNEMFEVHADEIAQNEKLMATIVPGFTFDKDIYFRKAALIKQNLKGIDKKWDRYILENTNYEPAPQGKVYELHDLPFFLQEISLHAYRNEIDSNHYEIEIDNFHFAEVELIGYSVKPLKKKVIPFDEPIFLAGFKGDAKAASVKISLPEKPTRLFFRVGNLPGDIKKMKFIKWEKPTGKHPRVELLEGFKRQSPFYSVNAKNEVWFSGEQTINELLYIPEGFPVYFKPGTQIDFVTRGGLILNDNVTMIGSVDQPIKMNSSDNSSQGVTILQADSVFVSHVEMTGLNCLDYKGWTLTGAFNIYEAHASIQDLTISYNHCEDALNLIRSSFEIADLNIHHTASDGFDADFCTGSLNRANFSQTGNDCIDFSGSVVDISNVKIVDSGDKGVSAGEGSTLSLHNIDINGALTGLAAKDRSVIDVSKVTIQNAEVGVSAFQKKPEYGPSQIYIKNPRYANIERLGLVEIHSSVFLEGVEYMGYRKFDIDKMYARFEKK
jgi:hypothetical protein